VRGTAAPPLNVQSDKLALEKSAKEAPGKRFVRQTRDFVAEIAHA
jgi:hypothetical protein